MLVEVVETSKVKYWILACRPFAYPWMMVNTLLGSCLSGFSLFSWILSFSIASLVLTSAHFLNSWIDYVKGFDKPIGGSKPKPYTAGSQILPLGLLSLGTFKLSTFILLALSSILMVYAPRRIDVFLLYALGVFCAFSYSLWLKEKGLGEVALFLGHGFSTTCFSYSFSKPLDLTGLAAGVLLGFYASLIYTVDQWQDVETDFARRVRNLAYMVFKANMKISQLWYFLVTGSFTLQFGFIILGFLPSKTLLSIFTLPLGHVAGILLDYRFEKGVIMALGVMWLYALLMSVGVMFL
jgi:hypothetical protein